MKSWQQISLVLFSPVFLAAAAGAVHKVAATGAYSVAFEELTQLVGTWKATDTEKPLHFRYHLTGGASALVETVYGNDLSDTSMSTVYHLDGEDLMLTHYCGAGNQPRMKAVSYDPERRLVRFDFLDVTNLASDGDYYTREVEIQIEDEDRLRVRFSGLEDGVEFPVEFRLVRVGD